MRRVVGHRRTTVLLIGCLAFLAGVGLAHSGVLVGFSWVLLSGGLLLLTWPRRRLVLLAAVAFGLSLGWWRGSLYTQKLAVYDGLYYHKVTLLATASEDGVYNQYSQITFNAGGVINETSGQRLAGHISLSGFGLNAVFQGDQVEVSGKLYPTLGSNQARMSYAEMSLVAHHPSLIATIRRDFAAGMQNALPEPLASFAMGLLIGQRATLPDNVKQDLLMVGLTHIIAVSGYNLTIILDASRKVLGKRSKRLSTFLSLSLISVFLLLAGTSASIVRAAIVSVLSIAAAYYGRQTRPLLLISMAAVITAYANPFYIWGDSSWWLSFLAFYGVMVLGPLLSVRLPERLRESLPIQVGLESICAEMMTLPFILFTFGQMSFVGLPANVLVTALVPLAMLLSAVAGLAGMLIAPLAGWLAWPARILLTYMLDTAHLLSRIPHVFVQNLALSIAAMLFLYLLVITITVSLWLKNQANFATITDKKQELIKRVRTQQMVDH